MKIKTLVVAPYPGLVELTTSLRSELNDFDITVMQGDLSEVLPFLDRIQSQGYELIISRGGTAKLLSKYSDIPVVEIQVSGFDILRMLILVKGYHSKIKMIGFPNIIEGFVSVSSLMGMDISYTIIHHEDEVEEALLKAKADGVKVIVGDTITVKKAAEQAMQGVLITSGRESVMEAFSQAKQIYKISENYKQKNQTFETLINTMEAGYAIVDQGGMVQFANDEFKKILNLSEEQSSLFLEYPYFKRLIDDLDKGIVLDHQMILFDPDRKFAVVGEEILNLDKDRLYYLKIRPAKRVNSDIKISYFNNMDDSFPQFIVTSNDFMEKGLLTDFFPMAVYGERGVGKRFFAVKLMGSKTDKMQNAVELEILQSSESSFKALMKFISTAEQEQIIYIRGVENLSVKEQKELSLVIPMSKSRIIFSFNQDPVELKEKNRLDVKLYETFKQRVVSLPPLRERLNDLDEYIRTFLITFNERYGKQIVGLRPKVMEALYLHPWKDNLFELREVIEQFVKHSDAEYVEEDVLPLLDQTNQSEKDAADSLTAQINLNKTLDEIEKDVIQIVMEQEDMNQSVAAKRLGINRSTLWRKLKQ